MFDHFNFYCNPSDDGDTEDAPAAALDALLFSAGFSILAGGSKGAKIECGFALFDADGDGCLTEPEFIRLIQACVLNIHLRVLPGIAVQLYTDNGIAY